MLNLREIHKPKTIEEAVQLLKQPDTVALAGGTDLLASKRKDVRAVVDLSGLGLAYIRDENGTSAIGAMTTLADVAAAEKLRAGANGVVAQAAQRSAASLLRNQATVAGTLIAEPAGIFATTLAALDARVVCRGAEMDDVALCDFLPMREHFTMGGIVMEVVIPAASLRRRGAIETVARTPRDQPIVAVCVAVELADSIVSAAAIAVGGLGEVAARASEAEKLLLNARLANEAIEGAASLAMAEVETFGDFRGSAEYRREMVRVLVARALRTVSNQ